MDAETGHGSATGVRGWSGAPHQMLPEKLPLSGHYRALVRYQFTLAPEPRARCRVEGTSDRLRGALQGEHRVSLHQPKVRWPGPSCRDGVPVSERLPVGEADDELGDRGRCGEQIGVEVAAGRVG